MSVISQLQLPPCLRSRINYDSTAVTAKDAKGDPSELGFVLYLPTVCLRLEQNPAFALAVRVANHMQLPLVVLAVVCDDTSHHNKPPGKNSSSVVMTSRRLAFTLQALSHACHQWSAHGAAVGCRVHGPNGARNPDYLTLASNASFVVTDEPFVSPYSTIARKVKQACRKAGKECVSVDASTTVPPLQVLKRNRNPVNGEFSYESIPQKAYLWQNKTEHLRDAHIKAAMNGDFCAPELQIKLEDEDLFQPISVDKSSLAKKLAHLFPRRWKPVDSQHELPSCPDVRPFTSKELQSLYHNDDYYMKKEVAVVAAAAAANTSTKAKSNVSCEPSRIPYYNFLMQWPGADSTVPPCEHTIGTSICGMNRWNTFVQKGGLLRYAKERNNAKMVHSVSRMSAYLNLGIVSIFRLVWEVKRLQRQARSNSDKTSFDKFLQEIIKFREIAYGHCFSRSDYDDVGSLPRWSVDTLNGKRCANTTCITLNELETGTTNDATWNAMQSYLIRTGELHNNVRMTWGKTVTGWVSSLECEDGVQRSETALKTLCYLNDRFALDGLSPPSYAGILWCMGWTDKPTSNIDFRIPLKHAYSYRMSPNDFREAEVTLQDGSSDAKINGKQVSVIDMMKKQPRSRDDGGKRSKDSPKKGMKRNRSIESFFTAKKGSTSPNFSRTIG